MYKQQTKPNASLKKQVANSSEQVFSGLKTLILTILLLTVCALIVLQRIYESRFMAIRFQVENIQVFNKQKEGRIVGQSHIINIGYFPPVIDGFNYYQNGLYDRIQVGSKLDFANLSLNLNWNEIEKEILDNLPYQTFSFNINKSKLVDKPRLLRKRFFENVQEVEKYLKYLYYDRKDNIQFNLGVKLALEPTDQKIKQAQFLFYDKKYGIGSNNQQIPICLISTGFNIYSKNNYKRFFTSIERQNYTNFHLIIVDDHSPDNSAYHLYQYLRKRNSPLKTKTKIIRNLQHMGDLGSFFFWVKKYCNLNDIVINVDTDDRLIGNQVFHIFNSIYKNQNLWYVYSQHIIQRNALGKILQIGIFSSNFTLKVQNYRFAENVWKTHHIRTFRKQLSDKIPIDHYLQIVYNNKTGKGYPQFYNSANDRFLTYSHLQLCGNDRLRFINDFLYLQVIQSSKERNCQNQGQIMNEYKCRIKRPFKRLNSFQHNKSRKSQYKIQNSILANLKRKFWLKKWCASDNNNFYSYSMI